MPGRRTTADVTVAAAPEEQPPKYHCPMHPQIVSDQPGQCPICQMSLVPLAPAKTAPKSESPALAALATVDAPVDRLQAMGVRVEAVTRGPLGEHLHTVGRVTADEGRLARVQVRFTGYVEKVLVAQQGARVRQGEPLAVVQSDEVLRLEGELLQSRTWGGDLADRARQRLRLLGVAQDEISSLEARGRADGVVLVRSPIQGDVVGLDVIAGDRVEPGRVLFEVADLSRVLVMADVYEREISRVVPGLTATLSLDSYPGTVFTGRIEYVSARLDPQTRSLPVRIALQNPRGELKPGLFATVEIRLPRSDGLTVSSEAVIDTGDLRYVFVETAPGHFEPRSVATGERTGDRLQVLSGLAEGDRVATGGNFFIDSESRLRASVAQTPATPATKERP
jgi:Cu(I)/Ag(I) efflux system membrane fusion protein